MVLSVILCSTLLDLNANDFECLPVRPGLSSPLGSQMFHTNAEYTFVTIRQDSAHLRPTLRAVLEHFV